MGRLKLQPAPGMAIDREARALYLYLCLVGQGEASRTQKLMAGKLNVNLNTTEVFG
jgi:hypothetical protein